MRPIYILHFFPPEVLQENSIISTKVVQIMKLHQCKKKE